MSDTPKSLKPRTSKLKTSAGEYLSAIKWVAIAIVFSVIAVFAWKAYHIAMTPVRVAQDMGSSISETTASLKKQTGKVVNRLEIPIETAKRFELLSETAFQVLVDYPVTKPKSVSDRMFRAANLRHSLNQVCEMQLDFGNGPIPVFAAANNKAYMTAKDLGAKEDRIIRVHIKTGDDDLSVRSYWDRQSKGWAMRWRRATLGKPISDEVAQARLVDVLKAIPDQCVKSAKKLVSEEPKP